jgi:hypothetical protein
VAFFLLPSFLPSFFLCFMFWRYWSLNSGSHTCQVSTHHLSHALNPLAFLVLVLFFRLDLMLLSGASPDSKSFYLYLPSIWDDNCLQPCLPTWCKCDFYVVRILRILKFFFYSWYLFLLLVDRIEYYRFSFSNGKFEAGGFT